MMRRSFWLLVLAVPLLCVTGCGGDKEKGVYKDKEKPVAPEKKT
jgi:hypothetical protein